MIGLHLEKPELDQWGTCSPRSWTISPFARSFEAEEYEVAVGSPNSARPLTHHAERNPITRIVFG
jgi:hypothetical protein